MIEVYRGRRTTLYEKFYNVLSRYIPIQRYKWLYRSVIDLSATPRAMNSTSRFLRCVGQAECCPFPKWQVKKKFRCELPARRSKYNVISDLAGHSPWHSPLPQCYLSSSFKLPAASSLVLLIVAQLYLTSGMFCLHKRTSLSAVSMPRLLRKLV